MTTNSQQPSWEQLLDWVEGRLSEQDAALVAAQAAAAGQELSTDVAWLNAFVRLQRAIVLEEPPPQVRSNLVAQFADHVQKKRATARKDETAPGLFQRLIATLTLDSGLQPLAAGLRSTDASAQRQLIFSTEAADVMLNVQRDNADALTIKGQLLPLVSVQADAFTIQLISNETIVASTQPDALGTFVFDGLLPNRYQLALETESLVILVGPFELQ